MTISKLSKIFLLLAVPSLAIFTFSSPLTVQAANEYCLITNKLNDLLAIKDNLELSNEEKVSQESSARLDLLNTVISCSSDESEKIKDQLADLEKLDDITTPIQEQFIEELNSFIIYFEDQQKVLAEISDDNNKVKELAQNILTWRSENYNPTINNIVDFIFLFKQESVIMTADSRLAKIKKSLNKILSLEDKEVDLLLAEATNHIIKAKDLREEAFQNFITNHQISLATTTPDTLLDEEAPTEEVTALELAPLVNTATITPETTEESIKPTIPVRDLIKESLLNIKKSYDNFFNLSRVVKNLLSL